MEQKHLATIGVFGGSGFYKFLDNVEEVKVETPYGMPSDNLMIGKIGKHKVAFMPRHGRNHTILPHLINYRANVWAMKYAGCERVISPCASGSLQKHINPNLVTNLLCFGDSIFEIKAGKILASKFREAFIKTIKFKEAPKLDDILKQLTLNQLIL